MKKYKRKKQDKQYIPIYPEKYCGQYPIICRSSWEYRMCQWLDNNTNTSCQNVYYIGGTGIIPYSFSLEIADSIGEPVSISDFHIDDNGDNFRLDSFDLPVDFQSVMGG